MGDRSARRDRDHRRRRAARHLPRQDRGIKQRRRMSDAALGGLQERIRAAAAAQTPLVIRGAGTRDFYGQAIVGERLDMSAFAGIVDYDPTELVVTASAGTPVADIDDVLAA